MKKNERLELIKKMVLTHSIETQHDLLALLAEQTRIDTGHHFKRYE